MKNKTTSVFVFLLLAATALFGQLTRGFISGVLEDSSGAVIADATIRITNQQTNQSRDTVTNSSGVYRFVAVEPGTYVVEFSKNGFETKRVPNVSVTGTQEVTINQALTVGATTTTVEVVEAVAGVELSKSTATIERKLDQNFVQAVALTGNRDINQLALLAPTATRAPGSTGVSAGGQRARNNNFLIDGTDNNDPSVTVANSRQVPEALSEFQVQAQAYSAEFGRNTGAQIQVFTRSGTNELHGEVYDYYRGNWLEPVSLLNERNGLKATPRYNQNQAGGLLGGPVIKNRTFFFSHIDANRRREAPSAANAANATIITPTGYAALSSIPLGPDQTTASRQAALQGLSFLTTVHPQVGAYTNRRNVNVNGVPIEVGTVNIPIANPSNFWLTTHKIDHRLSDKDNISYRLIIDRRNQPDVASNLQFGSLFSAAQVINFQNHAFSHTRTFSPRFVNEFRFAYIGRVLDFPENDPKTPTTGISGFFTIGGASNFPQGRNQKTQQYTNVSTYLLNKHSLKMGADIRYNMLFNNAAFDSKGTFNFDNLQDFINNRAATFAQAVNTASFDARQKNLFFFFQDDWKVTRDLTINLGVRYEYSDAPFGFFGATDQQSLAVGVPGPARADKNNWAPRAGFAYSPSAKSGLANKLFGDGQTVFRGGFGMGYDVLFFNILTVNASNFPRVVVSNRDRTQLPNVWPQLLPVSGNVAPTFNPFATYVNSPVDTQNPTSHFYSFSIQRQLKNRYIFEVGYTGARSYHGVRQGQGNPGILTAAQAATVRAANSANAIPGLDVLGGRRLVNTYGGRVLIETTALGRYDAMYLKLDKRLSNGLSFGANYTWSANLSDNDESLGVGAITGSSPQIPQDFFNYRNEWSRSAFDVPHRLAFYYNYELPFFKSSSNPLFRHVLGGWQATGFSDFQSGQPFTVRTGVDTRGTGTAGPHRPNWNPTGSLTLDPVTGDWRTFSTPLNGGVFVTPLNSVTGIPLANSEAFPLASNNLGRNTFRGPGIRLWNISASKTISVTERVKLNIRADWINAFNNRNFQNPVSTMNSPIFGQNTSDPGGRTMLLSGRIRF